MVIILDRDGVINVDSADYVKSADEWHPIDGSIEAIARLSKSGYRIAIATNQSGVGRGYYTLAELHAMHEKMCALVAEQGGSISHIAYCPHHPDEGCECRKPKPGLLREIGSALGIADFSSVIMVGDSLKDLQAAQSVGCRAALVKTGNGMTTLSELDDAGLSDISVYDNLADFVNHILK